MKILLISTACLLIIFSTSAVLAEDGFTQKDRELLIELKVRVNGIDKRFEQVDKRFDQVDRRFNDMFNFLYILAGIFTSLVVALIGFGYWDRKTIIKEARRETIEFIEKEGMLRRVVDVLKDLSRKDTQVEDALRRFNLL
jgi:hypothetical protein